MSEATTLRTMSPKLAKVAELAKKDPKLRLRALGHLLDEHMLTRAFHRLRKDAAVGVDGVTKDQYGRDLEANVRALHERMRAKRYRHQPIRRTYIPKAAGKLRPLGISCVEDKIVQAALAEMLEVLYEPVFRDCSYGFRPGRRAHDAIKALHRSTNTGEVGWVLEADIEAYFDSIDRRQLREMLRERIDDESLLRLIGKCLNVGVLDGEKYSEPDTGTAQGSVLSPVLGNVYLHHVLDEWLEDEVRPRMRGRMTVVRYADDFVIGFELREDAERVMAVLPKRMQRFGLKLSKDKTRLVPFQRPRRDQTGGKGPATFDFLGFTWQWRRGRRGGWGVFVVTQAKRDATCHRGSLRLVSKPSTPAGARAARGPGATTPGALQLLRHQRQRPSSVAARLLGHTPMAQVAESAEPTSRDDVVALPACAGGDASPRSAVEATPLVRASRETFVRKSRMVEISLSGSGEGPGRATARGYSTRAAQTIPPATRRLVMQRDSGRCVVPGCRHAVWVDVHHLVPRAEGGRHDPDALVVICGAHHRAIHRGTLFIEGTVSSGLSFLHADGTLYGARALEPARAAAASEAFAALRELGFAETAVRQALLELGSAGRDLDGGELMRAALQRLYRPQAARVREPRAPYGSPRGADGAERVLPTWRRQRRDSRHGARCG